MTNLALQAGKWYIFNEDLNTVLEGPFDTDANLGALRRALEADPRYTDDNLQIVQGASLMRVQAIFVEVRLSPAAQGFWEEALTGNDDDVLLAIEKAIMARLDFDSSDDVAVDLA